MKILGITTEGDSGSAIVENGKILNAVNEERLSRMKLVVGFPRKSIKEVLELSNTNVSEIDAVIVAAKNSLFVDQLEPYNGWLQLSENKKSRRNPIKIGAAKLSRFRNQFPFLEKGYYTLLGPAYWQRRQTIRKILLNEFDILCPIVFVDHHFSHACSAYFTSGFDDALVVSIDGGGDGLSSAVYKMQDGKFEKLHEVSAYNSLGNYYAYVTHICGFKAMKHEGKITGLAAHGNPIYIPLLKKFIDYENGTFVNKGGVVFREAKLKIQNELPEGWTKKDLAASIQQHFERLVCEYIKYWADKTGLRDIAVAGGVFANVRVNEEIHNLEEINRIFIHPHMSDGGMSVGAAFTACIPGILSETMPRDPNPIPHVYLGRGLPENEIISALKKYDLVPEALTMSMEETVANLIVDGYVVALADGQMEYGPRALGNRSILYQPTDPSVNDWLNKNLKRTEFMPFAPSTIYEERNKCYQHVEGAEHPAEFMTITFHCTPWMKKNMPGVVHIDGTARPHLVRKDRNPSYYRIISKFYERTGLPAIINTSFNMHEEPIVNNADDCVRAFLSGNLDYLSIGPFLVKHPSGITHPIKPVHSGVTNEN
jgi:carbamoyltransferase